MDTKMKRVLEVVSSVFGIPEHDIMGRIRQQYVSRARTALYYSLRAVPESCMSEIERAMGRTHGTVKQGIRAHYRWMASDRDYVAKIHEVTRQLGRDAEITSTLQFVACPSMPPDLTPVIMLMPSVVSTAAGYLCRGTWYHAQGTKVDPVVTHWAHFPQGVIK